jgi:glycopeptide antibiotics resistance protein
MISANGLPLVVPLAVGVVLGGLWVLLRPRSAQGNSRRDAWLEAGMLAATAPWIIMILTPDGDSRAVQIIPFVDMADVLASRSAIIQMGGNLLVFAGLGALVPLRWAIAGRGRALGVVAGIAAGGSVLVEVLQGVLGIGRVSSIDDVLLNTAGAILAACCTLRWWR